MEYKAPKLPLKAYFKLSKARIKAKRSEETDETENKFIDPRAQKYTKRSVESDLMKAEQDEVDLDEAAQILQDEALAEAEIERKKKRDEEREEYLSVLR